MIVNGPFTGLGKLLGKGCFMVFATAFLLNIALLALTFVHRYIQICKKHLAMRFMSAEYMSLTVAIIVVPVVMLDLAMIYAYTFTTQFSIHTSQESYEVRALYVENIGGILGGYGGKLAVYTQYLCPGSYDSHHRLYAQGAIE
uniref:G_PROTEIN_RECEP_F1_2 domain-containing protein n=1 Tax=Steinernema glaseri TaxID=37863 RepID=A0A1I7Z431_9BILA